MGRQVAGDPREEGGGREGGRVEGEGRGCLGEGEEDGRVGNVGQARAIGEENGVGGKGNGSAAEVVDVNVAHFGVALEARRAGRDGVSGLGTFEGGVASC